MTALEEKSYKSLYNDCEKLMEENKFLRQRENKLQLIEQMFKNEPVDLSELAVLVKEGKNENN